MTREKFVRSRTDRMLFGVAGGIANALEIDPVFVRLAFVLAGLATAGNALLVYLLLALLMPEAPAGEAKGQPFDDEEIVVHEAV
jgi:phage shock protein C